MPSKCGAWTHEYILLNFTRLLRTSTAQSVTWLAMGWMIEVSIPGKGRNFSLHDCAQTGSGAHPVS